MDDTQGVSAWFLPLVPVLWLFVTALVAEIGGWRDLARLYRDPDGAARAPLETFWIASLRLRGGLWGATTYGNCVIVEVSEAGLHLRIWLPFRFRHPPLFIPWTHVDRVEHGRIRFFRALMLQPSGVGTRIYLYGRPARAVDEVWRRHAARSATPAPI